MRVHRPETGKGRCNRARNFKRYRLFRVGRHYRLVVQNEFVSLERCHGIMLQVDHALERLLKV